MVHWRVMKELHEHIVNKAVPAVDTKHQQHVVRYASRKSQIEGKKYASMTIDDALLEGPERDWWRNSEKSMKE